MSLDRKSFLKSVVVMAGAGLGLAEVAGCADDGPSDRSATGGSPNTGGGSSTGGSHSGTGGSSSGTGGNGTGGSSNDTGGSSSGTGGSTTGGSDNGTGGDNTGGSSNGTGGDGTGGGDVDSGSGANACDTTPPASTIADNHGHVLMVSQADAAAAVDKTYDIKGTAKHTHSVTVTAAMFAQLQGGTMAMTTSTTGGGHTHGITIICA